MELRMSASDSTESATSACEWPSRPATSFVTARMALTLKPINVARNPCCSRVLDIRKTMVGCRHQVKKKATVFMNRREKTCNLDGWEVSFPLTPALSLRRGRSHLGFPISRVRHFGFCVGFRFDLTRPIAPVDVGKNVVEPFDSFEPGLVDFGGCELLLKRNETKQVSFHALPGVFRAGAGSEDERPIAGLGEEQFASSLFEGAFLQNPGLWMAFDQLGHTFLRDLQVGINPFVGLVEPDFPIAFVAPTGGARFGDLLGGIFLEVFPGRRELDHILVVNGFADEVIQELRSFIP